MPEVRGNAPSLPVDLFILTTEELARHTSEENPLLREALEHGRDLL